ncbi:hypothetical protein ACIBEJ_34280 [Nonomuraea sp. NPDC050790]|uniref:hypothetical protein n=1 Tax=Nonomuraea sp. NPDC050790 TaxID=3364371 RepID=UPI00379D7A2D
MVTVVVRAKLRFVEQAIPSRTPIRTWKDYWEHIEAQRRGQLVARPSGHNPATQAFARVDDGRWIADCPWGCGSAFNLPEGTDTFWCTECAGGGWGLTAELIWPSGIAKLTRNLESLPVALQYWPCIGCRPRLAQGKGICGDCLAMQGQEA